TSTMPMTLGYWDIRGLAHAIRLLLEYTDSSYEEKRYTLGTVMNLVVRSQWLSEKFTLGLDFPNVGTGKGAWGSMGLPPPSLPSCPAESTRISASALLFSLL
uniref:GST N-terminal domain-containing protein n=1 Tax=Castor canadensis TaxID=51338 RepID=A0A8C0XM79_CASCN